MPSHDTCKFEHLKTVESKNLTLYRCNICQMVIGKPIEDVDDLYGKDYYSHWVAYDDVNNVWDLKIKSCSDYIEIINSYTSPTETRKTFLDIGCAHGFMLQAAQDNGFDVTGVEVSPASEHAKSLGFDVRNTVLENAGLENNRFSAITMLDVIEHIPNYKEMIRTLHTLLEKNGVLLMVTPDYGSLASKCLGKNWPHLMSEHVNYFSGKTLASNLSAAGFKILECKPAFKHLTLDYILGHFHKVGPAWFATMLKMAFSILPNKLRKKHIKFKTELLVVAKKY